MQRLRISAISYLNTAPLMWDFEQGAQRDQLREQFDVTYTIPSACAVSLQSGAADIGIIPVAAYATIPGLCILPGVAIASLRRVRSILLVSKKPLDDVKTVALDTSSMTSVVLCKVLLNRWLGGDRNYVSHAPDLDGMLSTSDAALLIGDPALVIQRDRFATVIDLAEEWRKHTAKPFVFAFWVVRKLALEQRGGNVQTDDGLQKLAGVFQTSRDHGLSPASLEQIASEWAPRLGLSLADVSSYLTENIHYYLDQQCREGLRLFYDYAAECGALPPVAFTP
jgi:chorismate dehydratase